MPLDIVGIGQCVLDRIIHVDRMPGPGRSSRVLKEVETGGGMAANAMVAASRLGLRCAIIAAVGDDAAGAQVRRELEADGVDTRGLRARPGARTPSWMMFFSPDGERAAVLFNRETMQSPAAADVDESLFDGARVFFTDCNAPAAAVHAARLARGRGMKVACDMQAALETYGRLGVGEAQVRDILDHADLFMPSIDGLLTAARESAPRAALHALMARYPQMIIAVTLGADGSLIAADGAIISVPAFAVEVVDTVGAGDTYHAAFMYGLYFQHWTPERAGRFASAAAAIKCTRVGGHAGPSRAEVEAFLAQNGIHE